MSQDKTETATFRIEKDILENLREESKNRKITLNAIVNQILTQFVEWYSPAKKANMIFMPKGILVKIISKLTKEEVVQVAEYVVKNEMKDILLVVKKEYSVSAFLDGLESWAKNSGLTFFHEKLGNNTHKYVISHEMGIKSSLFFGVIFTRLFEEMGATNVNFEITDKTLNFRLTYFD